MMLLAHRMLITGSCLAVLGVISCGGGQFTSPTAPSSASGASIIGLVNGDGLGSTASAYPTGSGGGMSAMGAVPQGLTVTIVGTSLTVSVDASGRFQFVDVPVGDNRLMFRSGSLGATVVISNVVQQEQVQIQVVVTDRTATIVSEERSTGKVELCHRSDDVRYHLIVVSTNAEPAHRAHGDGAPGERVPGAPTSVFDRDCRSVNPGVAITKLTNGQDADTAPGPTVPVGNPVIWEYVVTNTGTQNLTNIRVVDDRNVVVNCGGRTTLAIGQSMTCTGSGTAVTGQYRNVGAVTADSPSGSYRDSNPSHYLGQPTTLSEQKVQLCHRTGNGRYNLIEVSVNAEPAHRAHGDAKIGEPVPANPSQVFGPNCSIG